MFISSSTEFSNFIIFLANLYESVAIHSNISPVILILIPVSKGLNS